MAWDYELRILLDAIRAAGAEALRLSTDGFETLTKSDLSPVTTADLAVNQILQSHLLAHFPHDGWLSEESSDGPARQQKARVWVIDPIDGTKAFIMGEPEFCISAALVEEGRPVVAAIFNPSTDELFTARRGGGLRLNQESVSLEKSFGHQQPVIALSPWEHHLGRFKSLEAHTTSRPMRSIAWALALAASRQIHAVATFETQNEWDVAAGALLIEEAGGTMHDGGGQALGFNRPEPRYRGIVATSPHCPDPIRQQLGFLTRTAK
jgi:myo-inositol-1(or 4)-monophosphatase